MLKIYVYVRVSSNLAVFIFIRMWLIYTIVFRVKLTFQFIHIKEINKLENLLPFEMKKKKN